MHIPMAVQEAQGPAGFRTFIFTSRRPCLVGDLRRDPGSLGGVDVGPAVVVVCPGTKQPWVPVMMTMPDHIKPAQMRGLTLPGPFKFAAQGEHPEVYDLEGMLKRFEKEAT